MNFKELISLIALAFPILAEEYAFSKLIPQQKPPASNTRQGFQKYGWRYLWDAAFFAVLVNAVYNVFINSNSSILESAGYYIFLCGVALRILSLKDLNRYYDPSMMIQSDHRLVRTGIYRRLRHPLHLATFIKISGLALLSPPWLMIPAILVPFLLGLVLNRAEDKLLAQTYGDAFTSYYLETWDVLDLFIWKKKPRD